eukprot:scaffold28202_cov22-Tisochrysis_lutea.AAC.2
MAKVALNKPGADPMQACPTLCWTDMQRRWSEKNHTTIRDELLNPVVVGNPLGVYAVLMKQPQLH